MKSATSRRTSEKTGGGTLAIGANGYLARQVSYEPLILMLELVSMGEWSNKHVGDDICEDSDAQQRYGKVVHDWMQVKSGD